MHHKIRWTSKKIAKRLELVEPLVYRRWHPLPFFRYKKLDSPVDTPPLETDFDDDDYIVILPDTYWGEPQDNFLLRTQFQVPDDWSTDIPTALYLPLGEAGDFSHPEALIYIDDKPYASCDRHHQEIVLPVYMVDGADHGLALYGWTGSLHEGRHAGLLMRECAMVQIDQNTRDFIATARVTLGVADHLDENNPVQAHLYNALDKTFKVLDTRDPLGERFYASVPEAHAILKEGIARSGAPLGVQITAIGHAHIDVAWLWTLDQTRRKAGRTFHNVIRLMEQFPEFHFVQSQPQLYDFVRQDHPELFENIQGRVTDGQWEPIGGMWVEADCNLSGGESLARQFLLGRRFFEEHFGKMAESSVLWLPDVFGYAWNLPQLIKEAGLNYFFTIKMGWSQYNRFPYDSFWWQGLDGTRVLTHFSPTKESGANFVSTYNAKATPQEVLNTWKNFQQKDWGEPGKTPPLLMVYGFGDGGGGPTPEMLENIREMKAFPGIPNVQSGKVKAFFEKLESEFGERLPIWNGELYLEYHRGTYTTQARNKRANRKSEFLLHDVEFLASLAKTLDPNYTYPYNELNHAWELVCLNQFHDIIPGSSIGEVYADSLEQYTEVREFGERIQQEALKSIGEKIGGDLLVINPTSFARQDAGLWNGDLPDGSLLQRSDGTPLQLQEVSGGYLIDPGDLPPYSVTAIKIIEPHSPTGPGKEPAPGLIATTDNLENNYLRVKFNQDGDITAIYDKINHRDILPQGSIANQFQVFEDRPKTPDAWEIDIFYDDRMWLAEAAESVKVIENGPLRATLEVRRRVLGSQVTQNISLTHNSPRLDFDTRIDWQERHILLKTAFPVDILSPVATYEIQWGNVQRPTHRNTSWDWARFETCAHKWVDLSEGGYGVSLLNDCKYGHDIYGNVIRLTLLRGPTYPDPQADLGEHHFIYSLLPHAGSWDKGTIAAAYALNDPLIICAANGKQQTGSAIGSFLQTTQPNIVIETVKMAEDGGGLVVRLYECQRKRGECTLICAFDVRIAWRTNLLEENQAELEVEGNNVRFDFKPYQIVTVRLEIE